MPTRKVAVIAIGGNSLIISKDAQTVQDQYKALCVTGRHIASLVELGYQVVVTYGNGPQVGFLLWRSEVAHATSGLHGLPLVSCVADTQGGIGYRVTCLAVGAGHPCQIRGHSRAAQFFLPDAQLWVAADHAFYIGPPIVSWAAQSSSPPCLCSMAMLSSGSCRMAALPAETPSA